MPSAILSLRVTRNGIVGGGGLVVITSPVRVLGRQQVATLGVRGKYSLSRRPSRAGNILRVLLFGVRWAHTLDRSLAGRRAHKAASGGPGQSIVAMKPTTLSSCSFFTMRASSALGIPVTATRTLYKPPAVGPLAIDNLLLSRNFVTSSVEACGAKRMRAKVPASGAVAGADAVWYP